MINFDAFLDKAQAVANAAVQKTGAAVEVSKLKLQAMQIQSDIRKAYERLGSVQYEQVKTGVDNSDVMEVCVSELDALLASLRDLDDRISATGDTVCCPNCGAVNPVDAVYCSRCGSSLQKDSASYSTPTDVESEEADTEPDHSADL